MSTDNQVLTMDAINRIPVIFNSLEDLMRKLSNDYSKADVFIASLEIPVEIPTPVEPPGFSQSRTIATNYYALVTAKVPDISYGGTIYAWAYFLGRISQTFYADGQLSQDIEYPFAKQTRLKRKFPELAKFIYNQPHEESVGIIEEMQAFLDYRDWAIGAIIDVCDIHFDIAIKRNALFPVWEEAIQIPGSASLIDLENRAIKPRE